jgi:hypothetical protein
VKEKIKKGKRKPKMEGDEKIRKDIRKGNGWK